MALYNKIDREVLKEQMRLDDTPRTTISFYCYHYIQDTKEFRDQLYLQLDQLDVKGRVYVANEGINAQISVPTSNLDALKTSLYSIDWLDGVRLNIAVDDDGKSFYKLKIKIRKKIVADGLDDHSFDVTDSGTHVDVKKFNELLDDPNTITVDMRNHYETEVGYFKGAVTPDVDTFRDSLPIITDMLEEHKDKNLLMYCTGGIRCEKASAYFKDKGHDNVYQLEGGIIKYANDAKEAGLENKFIGKNFVFDERRSERITDDVIANCHICGTSCDVHTNCVNEHCNLLFIQCDSCKAKLDNCCSTDCQDLMKLPTEERRKLFKGKDSSIRIFTKGRIEK